MAEPIGALRAELSANAAQFEKDMGRARKAVNDNATRMRRDLDRFRRSGNDAILSIRNLRNAAGALGVVFSAGALVRGMRQTLSDFNRLADTADKVGVGIEALQELRFAAEETGVATNTLDMAMQRLTRRLGEAAQGKGELKDTLIQYGIAVTDAEGRTRRTEDVLFDLADAIKGADSDAERLRIAFKAFDSEGAALVNTMRNGREGLAAFADQARELGGVVEESLVREAAKADRELARIWMSISMRAKVFMAEFINIFRDVGVEEQIRRTRNALEDLEKVVAAQGGEPNVRQQRRLDELRTRLAELEAQLKAETAATVQSTQAGTARNEELEKRIAKTKELTAALELENVQTGQLLGRLRDMPATVQQLRDEIELENAAIKHNIDLSSALGQKWAENFRKGQDLKRSLADMEGILEAIQTPQAVYIEQVARLNDLYFEGTINLDEYRAALKKAEEDLKKSTGETEKANDAAKELGLTFTSAFEEAIVSGGDLRDVVQGLGEDILRILTRKAVTEPLGNVFTGLLSGLPGLMGFASGGSFTVGGAGGVDRNLVAFRATRGETVTVTPPGQQAAHAGPGVVSQMVEVNVYAPPGSSAETRERSSGGGRSIDVILDEHVAGNIRPGTRTFRALQTSFGLGPSLVGR